MKIKVVSKPGSKQTKVELIKQQTLNLRDRRSPLATYKVYIKELPVQGQANKAIIKVLAEYFSVAPSLVTLISGSTSKQKIFEIKGK